MILTGHMELHQAVEQHAALGCLTPTDGGDVVLAELAGMRGPRAIGENPTMDAGVQGLYPATKNLRKPCDVRHRNDGEVVFLQLSEGTAGGENFYLQT